MTTAIDRAPIAGASRGRTLAAAAFALPPLILLALALGLALDGGGVPAERWQPAAVALVVSVLVLAVVGAVPALPRVAWPMLAALAGLIAWSAISLVWSDSREATAENVVRLLLLAAAAVVGAAYAARPRAALALAAGLALMAGLAASFVELKLLAGSTSAFAGSRLSWPIDYANADAALIWMPLPALIAFTAGRALHAGARVCSAFFAALALATGLLAESRGATIALAAALIAAVAIARDRGRFALTTLAVAAPVGLASVELLRGDAGASAGTARAHGAAALGASLAAAGLAAGLAMLDRRDRWPFGGREGRAAAAVWALVVVVGVVAFAVDAGRPDTWFEARWQEFQNPRQGPSVEVSRFSTGLSNRYEYWRVAWHTFEAHPVQGVGSGAFGVPWLRSRSIDESVADAHSWEASALAETGLVGFVLAAAVLLLPFTGAARARRGGEPWPLVGVALGATAVYFVVHASLDWLFRIPAIAIPGFVVLGALAAAGTDGGLVLARTRERAALALAALLAAAAVVPSYLSVRKTEQAQADAATSSGAALARLATAADLNPFASEPLVLRASVLDDEGRSGEAVRAAEEATRRAPNSAGAWLALAEARRRAGRAAGVQAALARAAELDPRQAGRRTAGR